MKHIKPYKIFESDFKKKWNDIESSKVSQDIQLDIIDICQELKDNGFNIGYQWWSPYEKGAADYDLNKYPYISISRYPMMHIDYSEVKETVEHIEGYLDECGYNISIISPKTPKNKRMSGFKIEMINREIFGDVNESDNYDYSDWETNWTRFIDNHINHEFIETVKDLFQSECADLDDYKLEINAYCVNPTKKSGFRAEEMQIIYKSDIYRSICSPVDTKTRHDIHSEIESDSIYYIFNFDATLTRHDDDTYDDVIERLSHEYDFDITNHPSVTLRPGLYKTYNRSRLFIRLKSPNTSKMVESKTDIISGTKYQKGARWWLLYMANKW